MGLATRDHLHIPYPSWAKDGQVEDGDLDFENWKELQRWADRFMRGDVLIFHWPGAVADHIDVRNGAGKFFYGGVIKELVYVFDIAPASGVTVEWELDTVTTWTHALGTTDEETQLEDTKYIDQHITGIVTTADATASGMTVFVYLA